MTSAITFLAASTAAVVAYALRPRGPAGRIMTPPSSLHPGKGHDQRASARRIRFRSRSRQRRRVIAYALPDALDLIVVTIQAGHLPLQALRLLVPSVPVIIGDAFAEVVARVDRGERLRTSLDALGEHLGAPALALASAIAGAAEAGTAVSPALDRLAHDAREYRRRAAEASARELPVRLSFPLVLCTLPSFVLVAIVPLLLGALSSLRAH